MRVEPGRDAVPAPLLGELQHAGNVVDLAGFENLAAAGRYCLEQGQLCIAVLFAKAELDRRNAHDRDGEPASAPWRELLRKAEFGDDRQLDPTDVASLL